MTRLRWIVSLLALLPAAALATQVQEVPAGGLNAWLVEDHALPIVTVRLSYEASGAAYDPANKEGLASFATSLLDEGAGDMDSLAFSRALEDRAIRFGAEAGEDSITIGLQTLSEFRPEAFRLLKMALTRPRFDAAAVERIRAATASGIKELQENPNYLASLHWKALAFAGHPYARPRIGTLASLAHITRDDIRRFGKSHFACRPDHIAVVGDITPAQVREWLSDTFLPLPPCAAAKALPDIALPEGARPVVVRLKVPQTVVQASLPSVRRTDPAYYAVAILDYILGGDSITSRLGEEIRNKQGLAYYADTQLAELDHAAYLSAAFATRNAEARKAVSVFEAALTSAALQGVTVDEVAHAKSFLNGSFPLQIEGQGDLADTLIAIRHFGLGRDYIDRRAGLIDAVTPDQVNAAAKTLLSHAPVVVMVGDPAEPPTASNHGKTP